MEKEKVEKAIKILLKEDRFYDDETEIKATKVLLKYIKELEQKESILNKVTDKLKKVGNKYIKEYKEVEKLDLIQQNTAVLQELSCVIDDIEDILKLIEGEKK